MLPPPIRITRRRMKLEELVAKIAQIEEHATLTLEEYPGGLSLERQRHIQGLARQIRAHLEDQLRAGQRQPEAERRFDPAPKHTAG